MTPNAEGTVSAAATAPAQVPVPASAHARVLRLEGFEPAAPASVSPAELTDLRRRYSVLFADELTSRRGGLGMVTRVTNAYGQRFALKTLLPAPAPEPAGRPRATDLDATRVDTRQKDALLAAFRAEYESQRALQGLGCVPALYGWGVVDGTPAILMEWVEGVTLEYVRLALAVDDVGRVSPPIVAALGRDLFAALASLAAADTPVVHRDVSPSNVMVRTSGRSLPEQVSDSIFDLCLIDFGSSVAPASRMGSLTRAGVACRWATPDYAPPEMLSDDIPNVADLRRSPAIDVYAAASVLFDLACGTPPFGEKDAPLAAGLSPYRLKVDCSPAAPVMAHADASSLDAVLSREPEVALAVAGVAPELPHAPTSEECARDLVLVDAQMADLLLACLAVEQQARPAAAEASRQLAVVAAHYAQNVAHTLRGEPLEPRDLVLVDASPLRARRALRVVAYAACVAMTAAVCATCVWGTASVAPLTLALPLVAGLALRARGRGSGAGLARALAGIVLGAACTVALLGDAAADLAPALLAACAAAWLPVAVDYATLSETVPTTSGTAPASITDKTTEGRVA